MHGIATKREARRTETARRLRRCALELTRDRGFDGWTMDDVAEAAEVSRRTVFNYYDTKADLVLGEMHDLSGDLVEQFLRGGPSGRTFDDLVHLATQALQEKDGGPDLELARLKREAMRCDPRLSSIVHDRFEHVSRQAVELVLEREGEEYGVHRAQLLFRLLVAVFDTVLERADPDGGRPVAELIHETVADARDLLDT